MKLETVKEHKTLVWGVALASFVLLMLVTPRIPQSQAYHRFADRRNFFGVPNTLNVISNFPFLVVGVVGLVLCLHGNYLGLSLRGEVWGWACFYVGVAATAFGSSYYHLKPDDARLVWDRLPMTIAFSSLMAVFTVERIDEQMGSALLLPLLLAGVVSVGYWRFADDLRPYALVQFVPCVAIPIMTIALPPRYTHSIYWLWAAGWYLLAKIEESMDKKIYRWTQYTISGHTLKHLSAAMVTVFITVMLACRSIKIERQSLWEKWKIQLKISYFQEGKSSVFLWKTYGEKSSGSHDETERLV
eukprot:c25681_g1_i1 orf=250-1152(-)